MRLRLASQHVIEGLSKFGLNPYGEANFRVIWGPSRTRIIGGFWADVNRSEYRRVLKYGSSPRWILERWRPASMYGTPEAWGRKHVTPDGFFEIGPFPVHGEYESCEVFQAKDENGRAIKGWAGFVPIEAGLIELTARAVVMGRLNSYSDIRIAVRDEELRKEREKDARFDAQWEERQHTHKGGLTIGAHGKYNHQEEVDDYARRIERVGKMVDARSFRQGFHQVKETN